MPYISMELRNKLQECVDSTSEVIAANAKEDNDVTAVAGNLNFFITRLLQELPRDLVKQELMKEELRYWIQPLMYGVLLDVVLEHKRRVNTAYEAEQVEKNGDCFGTPYFTKLVDVVNESGAIVGKTEIMVKRSMETLTGSKLKGKLVITEE